MLRKAVLLVVVFVITFMMASSSFARMLSSEINSGVDLEELRISQRVEARSSYFKPNKNIDSGGELVKAIRQAEKREKEEKEKAQKLAAKKQKQETANKQSKSNINSRRVNSEESPKNKSEVSSQPSKNNSNKSSAKPKPKSSISEQQKAQNLLTYYIKKYPILKGVSIYIKDCPNNWQGCAYYTKGVILIDPDHTSPLETIIAHEINHIIDYRTDGKIDNNDYHE